MADPLREKLKALVEEWQEDRSEERASGSLLVASTLKGCIDQLAAVLAESEPEADLKLGHDWRGPIYGSVPGICTVCSQPREAH